MERITRVGAVWHDLRHARLRLGCAERIIRRDVVFFLPRCVHLIIILVVSVFFSLKGLKTVSSDLRVARGATEAFSDVVVDPLVLRRVTAAAVGRLRGRIKRVV